MSAACHTPEPVLFETQACQESVWPLHRGCSLMMLHYMTSVLLFGTVAVRQTGSQKGSWRSYFAVMQYAFNSHLREKTSHLCLFCLHWTTPFSLVRQPGSDRKSWWRLRLECKDFIYVLMQSGFSAMGTPPSCYRMNKVLCYESAVKVNRHP